jgi:hypothetical protein
VFQMSVHPCDSLNSPESYARLKMDARFDV